MLSFEFVFIAHLMLNLLVITKALSAALQQNTQNICNAVALITAVKDDLKQYREDGWENLLGIVTTFCFEKNIFCAEYGRFYAWSSYISKESRWSIKDLFSLFSTGHFLTGIYFLLFYISNCLLIYFLNL